MNTTFAIGIPTLNRADLLVPALRKYENDFPTTRIIVYDNGAQDISTLYLRDALSRPSVARLTTLEKEDGSNIGVAAAWNKICERAFGGFDVSGSHKVENILMLNDDIYLGRKESHILQLIEKYKDDDFIIGEKGWCSFVLPKKTFEKIGSFDEEFWPAYFEDGDYRYRMQLQGMSYITAPELTPVYFRESMTRQKDPSLNQHFEKNKMRYNEKWGGLPELEMYDFPFNIRPK